MKKNADLLKERFANHPHPVMHGVIDTLISDSKNSCVLLGQRNVEQVEVAATLGGLLSSKDINWVKDLYQT